MKHCTTLAGESVTIKHIEYLQFDESLEELFEQVKSRVQAAEPVTPEAVVAVTVVALGDTLSGLSVEDQLELKTVVDSPRDLTAPSGGAAVAAVFSAVLSTIGSWRAAHSPVVPA